MSSLSGLQSEASSIRCRINEYEEDQRILQGKIRELETAKRQVINQKETVATQQSRAYTLISHEGWEGSHFTNHDEEVQAIVIQGYESYYAQADNAEDTIDSKIRELESEIQHLDSMISYSKDALSSVLSAIRNYQKEGE